MPKLGKRRYQELKDQITKNMQKHVGHKFYRGFNGEFIGTFEGVEFHSPVDLSKTYLKFKELPFASEYIDSYIKCECGS